MKNNRLYTLLALLLMAGGVTMQAQEQCNTDRPTGLFACQKAPDAIPFKQSTVVSVQDAWLHYGSEVYGNNLAYSPQEIPFSWAVSFPPSVLQSYDGFTLTRVAIYENYYIMGNLILGVYYGNEFMPLTLLNEQVFAPTGNVGFTDIVLASLDCLLRDRHDRDLFGSILLRRQPRPQCPLGTNGGKQMG